MVCTNDLSILKYKVWWHALRSQHPKTPDVDLVHLWPQPKTPEVWWYKLRTPKVDTLSLLQVYVCTCWTHTHTQWLFVHFPLKFMFKSLFYKGSKRCSRLSHWSHWSFKNHGLLFFFPDVDVWKEEILSSDCSQLQCRGVGRLCLLRVKGDVIKTSCLETYYFELGNL